MTYPQEIGPDYEPRLGDKVEKTHLKSGTVTVGTVRSIAIIGGAPISAWDNDGIHGNWLWNRDNEDHSFRLLSRGPRPYKVGDLVEGVEAKDLPFGTVIRKIADSYGRYTASQEYEVIKLASPGSELRPRIRYRRLDANFSWGNITGAWIIQYLPSNRNESDCG